MVLRQGKQEAESPRQPRLTVSRHEAEQKLKGQIEQGEQLATRPPLLNAEELRSLEDDAKTWEEYTSTLLRTILDTDEYASEFSRYISRHFYPDMPIAKEWKQERDAVSEKLRRLRSIAMRIALIPEPVPTNNGETKTAVKSRDIFLVHGHNDAVKESVARFLEKL